MSERIDYCKFTGYKSTVIKTFRHKGLKRLFEDDDRSKLPSEVIDRIRGIPSLRDSARSTEDLDRPSLRLHPLKGRLRGCWAVTVRANWRIVFRFEEGAALDVDFLDYH